jgi:hypothetical protein
MSGHVAVIDNRSPEDNWIINKSSIRVTVACREDQAGAFSVTLNPGQTRRVTLDVKANVYAAGQQKYNDLKYTLGRRESWEIHEVAGKLVMKKI